MGALQRRKYLQALAAACLASPVWAQHAVPPRRGAWPRQAVNLIVPFPAGGASAILGKTLAPAFERITQQTMQLKYVGGSGGLQGAHFAAQAAAHGEHLFLGGSYLAMARSLVRSEAFDFLEDLRPLALVAKVPLVVVVNPQRVRARTVTEWLADVSRKSMRYRMATAGVGSSSHMAAEILKYQASLQFESVHFRGAGPALHDVMSGSVDMMIDSLISCLPHIRAGRLKALMVSGNERVRALPHVPCAQEMGVSALEYVTWYGVFASSQVPASLVQQMVATLQQMGQDPAMAQALEAMGVHWGGVDGGAFATLVQQETLQWARRIASKGFRQQWLKNYPEGGV